MFWPGKVIFMARVQVPGRDVSALRGHGHRHLAESQRGRGGDAQDREDVMNVVADGLVDGNGVPGCQTR